MGTPVPYYQDGLVTIYHGDCREIAPHLGRFDLLLTDPPYGLATKLQGGKSGGWSKFRAEYDGDEGWDVVPPTDSELQALIGLADSSIVWGGNYFALGPSRCWLIWNKPERGFSCADAELAWSNLDKAVRVFDHARHEPHVKRVHPTQKPLPLMHWCFGQVPTAKRVLDAYMGSGTTLVAARAKGIQSVGIEISEEYCAAAVERLSQTVLPLFGSSTIDTHS